MFCDDKTWNEKKMLQRINLRLSTVHTHICIVQKHTRPQTYQQQEINVVRCSTRFLRNCSKFRHEPIWWSKRMQIIVNGSMCTASTISYRMTNCKKPLNLFKYFLSSYKLRYSNVLHRICNFVTIPTTIQNRYDNLRNMPSLTTEKHIASHLKYKYLVWDSACGLI